MRVSVGRELRLTAWVRCMGRCVALALVAVQRVVGLTTSAFSPLPVWRCPCSCSPCATCSFWGCSYMQSVGRGVAHQMAHSCGMSPGQRPCHLSRHSLPPARYTRHPTLGAPVHQGCTVRHTATSVCDQPKGHIGDRGRGDPRIGRTGARRPASSPGKAPTLA